MSDGDGAGEDGGYVPFRSWAHVPHYYGDYVRQLMLGGAALMLFAAPFYGDSVHIEFLFEVVGALVLVCLAALTTPWKKSILMADAVATGVGVAVFQSWALYGYDGSMLVAFILRQAISIIFIFAFYFSMKTVRAMVLGQVGKRDVVGEFEEPDPEEEVQPRVDRRGD